MWGLFLLINAYPHAVHTMATGANTAPLGRLHPVLAARSNNPELKAHLEAAKRVASQLFPGQPLFCLWCVHSSPFHSDEPAKKKRKSRWGSEQQKIVIPGLPTVLPSNMPETQQKLYISKPLITIDITSPHSCMLFSSLESGRD